MTRRSWLRRIATRTKKSSTILILLTIAAIVSALTVVGAAAITVSSWYNRTFDWRDDEYAKVEGLHAGYTRAKFVETLGLPVFDRRVDHDRYREQTFRRREYWVQAISDRYGTVVVYSVTACGKRFRPTFLIPGSATAGEPVPRVVLNQSTFASISRHGYERIDYYASGATANSRFHDIQSSGNPSNYKTFVWGLNDVCPDWFQLYDRLGRDGVLPALEPFAGPLTKAPAWTKRFRREVVVNTYAETAPTFQLRRLHGRVQIGVDRILTRTTDDLDARFAG